MIGTAHSSKIWTVASAGTKSLLLLGAVVVTSILANWRNVSLWSRQVRAQHVPLRGSSDGAMNKLRIEDVRAKILVEMDRLQSEMRSINANANVSAVDCSLGIGWRWYRYSSLFAKKNSMRLLIAQYTGLEPDYVEMLTISEKANRAYARKWKHDYVQMKGVAFDSGKPGQAGANKVALLEKAIYEGVYDAVLILDADAVVVDFDQDALDLNPNSMLLTAMRVSGGPHSWNVNNGVTLWNVRHEKMIEVWTEWSRRIVKRMHMDIKPSDQAELHNIFKSYSEGEMKGIVNALNTTHFHYYEGTFVKHVMRRNGTQWVSPKEDIENRKSFLKSCVDAACSKWNGACDDV